jgi:small subunit ribosomal protein S17
MNAVTATILRRANYPHGCTLATSRGGGGVVDVGSSVVNKALFSTTIATSTLMSSLSPQKQQQQQQQQQQSISMLNNKSNISSRNIISETAVLLQQRQRFVSAMPMSSSPSSSMLLNNVRYFSTTTTSGGGGGDGKEETSPPVPVPVVDFDDHSNSDLKEYDPYEIIKSFEDTSYYYPPSEELNPEYLAAKYQNLSNDELLDSSTITLQNSPDVKWNELIHSPPIRDKNSSLPNGTLVGRVVSTKMNKTINVAVDRFRTHTKYKKRMKYTRKFMAHDESEVASMGDTVLIVPSQRISKLKHFMLREILKPKGQL